MNTEFRSEITSTFVNPCWIFKFYNKAPAILPIPQINNDL